MENIYNLPEGNELHINRYIKFISSRPKRNYKKEIGYEFHHICPRAYGGTTKHSNMIKLTYREHFIAHLVLWKAYGGKMALAFHNFQSKGSETNKHGRKLTSRQFSVLRETVSEISSNQNKGKCKGKNNPFFGKHHNEIIKQLIREANSGKNNTNYGKHPSKETIKKLKDSHQKTAKPVIAINIKLGIETYFSSLNEANSIIHCGRNKITKIIKHLRNSTKGYTFRCATPEETLFYSS